MSSTFMATDNNSNNDNSNDNSNDNIVAIIVDAETIKATLQEWAQQQWLSQVTLSEEDSTLSLNTTTTTRLAGHVILDIDPSHEKDAATTTTTTFKPCHYTAASIFLQIRDPHQGLLPYRSVCKKYGVQDPVKALDKPLILAYFLQQQQQQEEKELGVGERERDGGNVGGDVASQQQPLLDSQQLSQPTTTTPPMMMMNLEGGDAKAASTESDMAATAAKVVEAATMATTTVTAATDMDMEELAPAEASQESAATTTTTTTSPSKKPSSRSKDDRHHRHDKDRHGKDRQHQHHHRSQSDKENKEKHRSSSSSGSKRNHASDGTTAGTNASPSKRHKSSTTTTTSSTAHSSSKSNSKPIMTNELLFSNLNVVVDKRTTTLLHHDPTTDHHHQEREALAIHQALSADGFQVTPDLLAQYQETSQWIASHEIPVGNSASILRATAGRDLKRVLDLFLEATGSSNSNSTSGLTTTSAGAGAGASHGGNSNSKHKSASSKSKSSHPSAPLATMTPTATAAAPPGTKPVNKYLLGKKPIIVVPKAMSAPISMINAHEFFANAKFVPRDVMLKQQQQASTGSGQQQQQSATARRGPPPSTFTRRVSPRWLTVTAKPSSNTPIVPNNASTGMLEFEIMDNPTSKLGVEHIREWQRIVAVVSLGQAWQFKDWPGPYGQAVSLFGEHVYGCYIGLEGDSVPPELSGWNVKKSKLSRDKRSLDSVTHANFWNELEEWMAIHKPELLPQTPTNH